MAKRIDVKDLNIFYGNFCSHKWDSFDFNSIISSCIKSDCCFRYVIKLHLLFITQCTIVNKSSR